MQVGNKAKKQTDPPTTQVELSLESLSTSPRGRAAGADATRPRSRAAGADATRRSSRVAGADATEYLWVEIRSVRTSAAQVFFQAAAAAAGDFVQ